MGAQNSITLIIQSFGLILKRSVSDSLHQSGSKILIRTLMLTMLLTVTATELASETNVTSRSDCRIIDGVPITFPHSNFETEVQFRLRNGTPNDVHFAYFDYEEDVVVNVESQITAIEAIRVPSIPFHNYFVIPRHSSICFTSPLDIWPEPFYQTTSTSSMSEQAIFPIRKNLYSIWDGYPTQPVTRGYYVVDTGRLWTEDLTLHNNSLRPIVIEDYFMVFGRPDYGRMDVADFKKNTIIHPGESYSFDLTYQHNNYSWWGDYHLAFTVNGEVSSPWIFSVAIAYFATEADVPENFELPEPTLPYTPPRPPGDLNNDGVVDVADFIHGGSREL